MASKKRKRTKQTARDAASVKRKASCRRTPRSRFLNKVSAFLKRHWKLLITTAVGLFGTSSLIIIVSSVVTINGCQRQVVTNTTGSAPIYNFNGQVTINIMPGKDVQIISKSLDELLHGEEDPRVPEIPSLETGVVLRDPPGLKRIAEMIEVHYEAGHLIESFSLAQAGYEIIRPIISPYMYRKCSIETVFAKHITAVYLTMAGEAWSRKDYATAKHFSHTVLGIWGNHVSGDVYAIAAAIELAERGGSTSVFCDETVRRFNRGEIQWVYDYMNRLARWGYLHPIVVDSESNVAYSCSYEEMFGFAKKLEYKGPYLKVEFPTKDGRRLTNGELVVLCYCGFGRFEPGHIPDSEGRIMPPNGTRSMYVPMAVLNGNAPRPGPRENTQEEGKVQ